MKKNREIMEWHRPGLDPEEIAKIIREGREENDKKFDSYAEYADYIYKDNERILKDYGDYMDDKEFEVQKNATIDFQEVLDELRKDRDERDDELYNMVLETLKDNQHILDAIGSDFDENGVPYWEKWDKK